MSARATTHCAVALVRCPSLSNARRSGVSIEAPVVIRVVSLADRDDDVDVGPAQEFVFVIRSGWEGGLGAAAVLPNETTQIAEPVTGHEEPECALSEHQVDACGGRTGIGQCGHTRDRPARGIQLCQ